MTYHFIFKLLFTIVVLHWYQQRCCEGKCDRVKAVSSRLRPRVDVRTAGHIRVWVIKPKRLRRSKPKRLRRLSHSTRARLGKWANFARESWKGLGQEIFTALQSLTKPDLRLWGSCGCSEPAVVCHLIALLPTPALPLQQSPCHWWLPARGITWNHFQKLLSCSHAQSIGGEAVRRRFIWAVHPKLLLNTLIWKHLSMFFPWTATALLPWLNLKHFSISLCNFLSVAWAACDRAWLWTSFFWNWVRLSQPQDHRYFMRLLINVCNMF